VSPATEAHPGHVVLVGMMATGKTTVGEWLAAHLDRPFLDSDQLVEARTGHTVKELFAGRGEAGFRAEESAALADSLAATEPVVIAAAGGAVLDPTNRRLIRPAAAAGGLVVWLRAEPAVLARRAVSGSHRPLLDDDPLGTLTRLAAVREPLYREVADLEIDETGPGGDLTSVEIGQRILARVRPDDHATAARPGGPGGRP
jgi:shikimate kinase